MQHGTGHIQAEVEFYFPAIFGEDRSAGSERHLLVIKINCRPGKVGQNKRVGGRVRACGLLLAVQKRQAVFPIPEEGKEGIAVGGCANISFEQEFYGMSPVC